MDALSEGYLSQLFEHPDGANFPENLLDLVRSTLTRSEEVRGARDQWGNWEFSFQQSFRDGRLFTPWLDDHVIRAVHLPRRRLWPDGKPFALCITHDVDIVNSIAKSICLLRKLKAVAANRSSAATALDYASILASLTRRLIRPRSLPEFDFYEWMCLEERYAFRSTFFFMSDEKAFPHVYDHYYSYADPALYGGKKMPVYQIMREIVRSGWEVGLHGSYNSAVMPGLLKRERERLSEVTGEAVISGRQHWLHFDTNITPLLVANAGLLVDSTHGFNRCIGFRSGTAFAYNLYNHNTRSVLPVSEFPQHVMDGALFASNSLEYPEDLATGHVLELMQSVDKVGGMLVISFHPNYWHAESSWRRVFENILSEAKRRNAWGCSLRDAYQRMLSQKKLSAEHMGGLGNQSA